MSEADILAATDRRRELAFRHTTAVAELIGRRRDIHGVVPMADLLYESVLWAA